VSSFANADERLALRPPLPDKLLDITLPGPERAAGDDRCALGWGARGNCHGLCLDI